MIELKNIVYAVTGSAVLQVVGMHVLRVSMPRGWLQCADAGIYQIINGDVHVSMLRKIEINDLLGREPVDLRMETIMRYVKDIEIGDTTYTKQENGSFTAPSTAAAVGQTATALPASSISVSGSVNRKKPGTYELTYTMQDKNGRHFYSNMAF